MIVTIFWQTKLSNDDLPLAFTDFSGGFILFTAENEGSYWYFDGYSHTRLLAVNNLRKQPEVGLMTGEITRGRNINALFDLLPESTIMAITIVIHPRDVEAHLEKISSRYG